MPFKSQAQRRFLLSKASPLSKKQKEEWQSATGKKKLPEKVGSKGGKRKTTKKSAL